MKHTATPRKYTPEEREARARPGYHDPTAGWAGAPPARSALTLRLVLASFGLVVCGLASAAFVVVVYQALQRSARCSPRWHWWTSSLSRVASCAANPAEPRSGSALNAAAGLATARLVFGWLAGWRDPGRITRRLDLCGSSARFLGPAVAASDGQLMRVG